MTRTDQIAENLSGLIFEKDWATDNSYKIQLDKLSWQTALEKADLSNSIAALVFHVDYYIHGVLEFLITGNLTIQDKYSFDLPEIKSDEDWNTLLEKFWTNSKEFIEQIRKMDDSKLNQIFVKKEYGSYQRSFDALQTHLAYHLAQISYIRKKLEA